MTSLDMCLACGGGLLEEVADLGDSPVLAGALFPDRESARNAVRGELKLAVCLVCGHVQNTAFDPGRVQYDVTYDSSLHFSGTFQQYADELVKQLVDWYDIRGKHVVEIGSGKGDFLAAIAEAGGNTGTGYDPTVEPSTTIPGVTLVQDYFRPGDETDPYDLLVCRHVLEHLGDPAGLLSPLAASAPREALHYFEVPAAEFNFGPDGLWDCIYPHVSYFSAGSLAALMRRVGFSAMSLRPSFHGQFLSVEAPVTDGPERDVSAAALESTAVAQHISLVRGFASRWQGAVLSWRDEIAALREKGETVAMWGAGSKGVNFLNAVDPRGEIPVVDINPRKAGHHLPGTGNEIGTPDSLVGTNVSRVLVTNPAYREEIEGQLAMLGVSSDVALV
ncbi:class I SAM-dependent methyltransferase [Phytoactinopolyspora alkaliphila]|uniref:Class I SAM-dependent methyltransferase n=1 Tax=Phytoactinopolyspora alkaliphila TaxID=1783498 RepID=A0A6N9YJK2_9ACTN|nr:class I SAM-dependent methyltransferase [Phytoactinopolyspora alkaliphila]NED95100.1 class I SAM-dependent methyltransferase [Phytoactinopolyspora alkaliphila]